MKRFMIFFAVVFTMTSAAIAIKFNNERQNKVSADVVSEPNGRVLQYGVYELVRGGKVVKSDVTSTGKAISKPTIQKVKQTKRVELKKDVYFAYQYRLSNFATNKPMVKLKRTLTHPEITLPDGRKITQSEYMIKGRLQQGEVFAFDGYALNEDYEMVEGDWIFQIWYQGKKLVEQKFTSYKIAQL